MHKYSEARTRLWILRHAVSTYNRQARFQGSSDESRLTEKGLHDARQAGEALAGIAFDAVYTSPLARAVETTAAVMAGQKGAAPVNTHPALAEISLFGWEGRRYSEVCEAHPDEYSDWIHLPARFSLTDEWGVTRFPVREAFDRARDFAAELMSKHVGANVLVVTHNGMGRALLLSALGLGPGSFHTIQQNNLGVSVLDHPTAGADVRLRVLNATGYSGARLPKPKSGSIGVRVVLAPEIEGATASRLLNGAENVPACSASCGALIKGLPRPELLPLSTVAVTGTPSQVDSVFASLPGLPASLVRASRLEPGHFTVVHYAGVNSPAAVLGLNISLPGSNAGGLELAA
jgi:broad specificity phosphatase PhoE